MLKSLVVTVSGKNASKSYDVRKISRNAKVAYLQKRGKKLFFT